MNSPVLPPQKLIVPQEFSLQLGFNFVSCTVGAYFCSVLVYYKTRSIRAFP